MVVGVFGAISTAVVALGSMLIGLVSSPFVLVVAGVAGIVTAFAYLLGSGNTTVSRLIDGFMKMVEFLDHALGSWHGFTAALVTLWDQLSYYWEVVWNDIKSISSTVWEWLKATFPEVVYGWG